VTFGDLGRPTVDKHSTGGVGDGVTSSSHRSLRLSGWRWRSCPDAGSVTTGGTLDKLESIPGSERTWSRSHREAGAGGRLRVTAQYHASCRPTEPSMRSATRRQRFVRAVDRRQRDVEETRRRLGPDPARREGRVGCFMKEVRVREISPKRVVPWPVARGAPAAWRSPTCPSRSGRRSERPGHHRSRGSAERRPAWPPP